MGRAGIEQAPKPSLARASCRAWRRFPCNGLAAKRLDMSRRRTSIGTLSAGDFPIANTDDLNHIDSQLVAHSATNRYECVREAGHTPRRD